jgi:hypothetical protein
MLIILLMCSKILIIQIEREIWKRKAKGKGGKCGGGFMKL